MQLMVWRNSKGGQKIPVPAWEVIPCPNGTKYSFKTSPNYGSQPIAGAIGPVYNLLSLGFYTHAQRIFWACKLLTERPHIAELLAARFPEIIVDEAQDTNAWLLILMNILRESGAKITLIGDPDQCIFEFSMADATSLPELKTKWAIPEMPLSQSFRCNNQIAAAVRSVGGNANFSGFGSGASEWRRAFVVKESSTAFSDGLAAFQRLADMAEVSLNSVAVVCRAHEQLDSLRGKVNYTKLKGNAKDLAKAAFLRDSRLDYRGASQIVESIVRKLTGDAPLWERIDTDPTSHERMALALAIWKFVKDPQRLLPVSHRGDTWIPSMRTQLACLIEEVDLQGDVKLGQHIKSTGLSAAQKALPLFETIHELPVARQDTIHQVKGESIDAVLAIGSTKFWNSVVAAVQSGENTENRRLAYVAMTRARHLLVVALPKRHYEKYSKTWEEWGFGVTT